MHWKRIHHLIKKKRLICPHQVHTHMLRAIHVVAHVAHYQNMNGKLAVSVALLFG